MTAFLSCHSCYLKRVLILPSYLLLLAFTTHLRVLASSLPSHLHINIPSSFFQSFPQRTHTNLFSFMPATSSTNQRQILTRRPGLAERYNVVLCTLPLDLSSRSEFTTATYPPSPEILAICPLVNYIWRGTKIMKLRTV